MMEFLHAIFSMPTAIFSVLLILAGIYWLTVILGFMDLGIFDGFFEGLFGAAEGAVEEAGAAVEGAVEGAAEAVGEAVAESAGEAAGEAAGEHHGCLAQLGLGMVPCSISSTVMILFAWIFSYGGMALAGKVGAGGGIGLVAGVGLVSVALGVGATAAVMRPLGKLFSGEASTTRRDLVGRLCTVTTQGVDDKFGQAEVTDQSAAILVQVRCLDANALIRGSQALICDYDRTNEIFYVVPVDDVAQLTEGGD
jgi:hypothetical protein